MYLLKDLRLHSVKDDTLAVLENAVQNSSSTPSDLTQNSPQLPSRPNTTPPSPTVPRPPLWPELACPTCMQVFPS